MLTVKISKTSPITVHYWWRHSEIVTIYITNSARSLPPSHLFDVYLGGFAMLDKKDTQNLTNYCTLLVATFRDSDKL
jgi:hypothetical protein